jgi:CRP-like cAMP-binding protein
VEPSRQPRHNGAVNRDERIAALGRVPLFSEANKKTLRAVEQVVHERGFEAGWTIAAEGGEAIGFFVIEEGEAEVSVDGKLVQKLGPGDYFGEIALLGRGSRTASVRALTAMRCLTIDSWDFRPLVRSNPDLSWALLEALATRLASSG